MKNSTKRMLALLLAAALGVTALTACGQKEEPKNETSALAELTASAAEPKTEDKEPETEPAPEKRDDLVVAMESEPPTLHPFDHNAVTAGYMNLLTYNSLFKTDPYTLEPVPDLCKSYEQVDDVTWRFTIYDNVTFHDGSHMTAEDVKASMEYARNYPTTKLYSAFWTDVKVVDEYTVEVTTDGSYALTLLDMSSNKIVPKALIEQDNDFNLNPVGSGPYKFVSQSLGDKLEFEAFDDYFDAGHQPVIKHLTWRIIPEGSSRTIALEAGEVDFLIEVEANDMGRLREDEAVEVQTVSGTRMNFFSMNNEVAPFDNALFRKAVNCAVDRDAVLTVALNGEGVKATGTCPSVFPGTSQDNVEEYDFEKAQQYLEQSGVDVSDLTFSCIVSNDTTRRAAEVVQANLRELGVEMTIESLDYAAWLQDVMGGTYETAITGYTSVSLARYLKGSIHTSAMNAANQARVSDSKLDAWIDLGMTQTDEDESNATFREATAYLNSLTPYVPLYESIVTRAYNSSLQGVVVGASGNVHFEDISWAD